MKSAKVFMHYKFTGIITEDSEGYHCRYYSEYLNSENAEPISLTLPLKQDKHKDLNLFPFFDGLIPEGWVLKIAQKKLQIKPTGSNGNSFKDLPGLYWSSINLRNI